MARELKRIAYVEDEPDIPEVVELVLTTVGGVELDVSTDGTEALRRIPAFGPDLILLDVMVPGMHGLEVFRRLCAMPECAAIPVVFMTAKAQKQECDSYLDLGAAAVIPKPFDPLALYGQLQQIWDRAGA